MKVHTCYTAALKQQVTSIDGVEHPVSMSVSSALMKHTSEFCLGALKTCACIFLKEWGYLSSLPSAQKPGVLSRKRAADLLVHSTKDNKARYPEFDRGFPRMPSYTRRAVIADALGLVSSYMSNHASWEKKDPSERGEEPRIGYPSRYELTFYDQERDLCDIGNGVIGFKLFNGKAWEWYYFRISRQDALYISKTAESRKMLSPVVEKKHGRYYVRFSFEEEHALVPADNAAVYTVLAVDLGINAPASWCVMQPDGTVRARGVIHLRREEDRLMHLINRRRMYQAAGKKTKNIYRMVTAANRELSVSTCREIIRAAVLYNVDCIVFEHLERSGRKKGKKYRERIHMWRANDVQSRVENQAHRLGMRISRVCAWGTSALAFDGSGRVSRGKEAGMDTYSACTFPNGKQYNCDISASLNIGARYFLRELEKSNGGSPLPKAPQRTYSTLVLLKRTA